MSAPRPYVRVPFRPFSSINDWQQFLYIQQHSSYFLNVVRSSVSCRGAYLTITHALLQKHSYLWFIVTISFLFFHMVRAGASWHKIHDIHACAFTIQTKQSVISFGFSFFGGPCEDIERLSRAQKPKFQSSTVVYLTLVNLLETKKVQEARFRDYHWCISIHFASFYFDEK